METDDGPVPGSFYKIDALVAIELVIYFLNPPKAASGVTVGKKDDALNVAQLFPGCGVKPYLEGDVVILGDFPGILEHLDDHIAGHPIIDLHQKFQGIGELLDFRPQAAKKTMQILGSMLLEIFDDGPGVQTTVVLFHIMG